jgi:hypothetical protein
VKSIFRSLRANPAMTLKAIETLPYLVQGLAFGKKANFRNENQVADKHAAGPNPVTAIFESGWEGPEVCKWKHYFDIYHRHLSRFVDRDVHVLVIGTSGGGSLLMWKQYFGTKAKFLGVTIDETCRAFEDDRTKVFIGDPADRSFWAEFKKNAPLIDIVIDDGGHLSSQQLVAMEEILPHIRPGGVYLCEDIHHRTNDFAAYLQGVSDSLNELQIRKTVASVEAPRSASSTFQAAIDSIHLYPFLAVVEKCERPVLEFVAFRSKGRSVPPSG